MASSFDSGGKKARTEETVGGEDCPPGRHNRLAHELQIHLHFVDEFNSPKIQEAIAGVFALAENMKDPAFRKAFEQQPVSEIQKQLPLLQFFERYASLVVVSGLSERLLFYEYADVIAQMWDGLYELREKR